VIPIPTRAKEKFKTYGNVFDNFTVNNLQKLIDQGHFIGLESPVSIGKEANIFTGRTGSGLVAVKIYRLEACDFNRMHDYLRFDVRYRKIRSGKRNVVFTWAQREYRNLMIARQGGVNVPKPMAYRDNVIVEEFIGSEADAKPAMKLRQRIPAEPAEFLGHIIDDMGRLFRAGLVHGDLSEYNILNHDETPVLIDFSTATSVESPNAAELLDRDIRNVLNYFIRLGVKADEAGMKKRIVGK
jgi:RIO kinase 1